MKHHGTNGACVIGEHEKCPGTFENYVCVCPCHLQNQEAPKGSWKGRLYEIIGRRFEDTELVAFIEAEKDASYAEGIGSQSERKQQMYLAGKAEGYKEGAAEERAFILNILDGIDAADEQMGNKGGGTKAIRFALQSRILPV